jgi:hypothetical protein
VARHLADAAAQLGPEEEAVVVYLPPGLDDRPAVEQWAAGAGLLADFALVTQDTAEAPEDPASLELAGLLVRLRLAPPEEDP